MEPEDSLTCINLLTRAGNVSIIWEMHISIIFSSVPKFCEWFVSLSLPNLKSAFLFATCPVCFILELFTLMFYEKYRSFCSACSSFQFPATISPLDASIFQDVILGHPQPICLLLCEIKFHTHIKQREKLYFRCTGRQKNLYRMVVGISRS